VNLREIEGLQIRRIEFSGNDKTNDYVVRRLFAMREGEPFGAGCWKEAFVG
jgi:outer membrane protein assembly factor BamA